MTAALLVGLLALFVVIFAGLFHVTGQHTDRGPRHRVHRPCPYRDRIRHLLQLTAEREFR